MPAPLLHLIVGSTGAGKTTYARRLADHLGAARFSVDEWMSALFWMDAPQPIEAAWAIARVGRCNGQIWRTALDLARRGLPSVLETGLVSRAARADAAERAAAAGYAARFHLLDLPVAERWRRVEARNAQGGADGQLGFAITRAMFDGVEAMWQPPDAAERAAYDWVIGAA